MTSKAQQQHVGQTPLWRNIQRSLDQNVPNWRSRIDAFGQVRAVERRERGEHWTDERVFEALLRAVLSNSTDWAKVESVLPALRTAFHGFSLRAYAHTTAADIERRIVPWFQARRAGSLTLRRSLVGLRDTARRLLDWSASHGSAEHFLAVLDERGSDPKLAAVELGRPGSPHKLPAFGVPIAAEALRSLGFDLSKPDRHVCRAVGAFGLVRFRNWRDRRGTKAPQATAGELLETMRAVEALAIACEVRPTFVDNAIWLLCARSGASLANDELTALAPHSGRGEW